MVGMERWSQNRVWMERRSMGRKNGSNARLDYRFLLDSGLFCRVRVNGSGRNLLLISVDKIAFITFTNSFVDRGLSSISP